MRTARRVVVARHGRTAWNVAGRYQGHADVPLDDEGQAQAAQLAERLAALQPSLIVSSDLRRALDSAAPLAGAAGLPLVVDRRLREVDVGNWEGLTQAEVAARHPGEWEAWNAGEDLRRGGGETRSDAAARAVSSLLDHAAAVRDGGLLIAVSHGTVLRSALRRLAAEGLVELDHDPPHLANATWLELTIAVPVADGGVAANCG